MVLKYFEEISRIPRGSGNEKGISDYLLSFAKDLGLWAMQDEYNNIIIKKPGCLGCEDKEPVILQGHMDMVCEKNNDKVHDFTTDPIEIIRDGDFLRANGTTLGADNGIAVAMAMALLASEDIPHPPLEIFMTTDEEVGMIGAFGMDGSLFKGRKLINLDSEEEGIFYVSCAGGLKAVMRINAEDEDVPEGFEACAIQIRGLKGGHSGMDIDKERGNSNVLLGRVINEVVSRCGARLYRISGGNKMNAIPRESECEFVFAKNEYNQIHEISAEMDRLFKTEYKITDPGVEVVIRKADTPKRMYTEAFTKKIIYAVLLTPNGVVNTSAEIPELVETSNNLGVITSDSSGVTFLSALRSSVESRKHILRDKLILLSDALGGSIECAQDYPGWEYSASSPLRDKLVSVYEKMTGEKPQIKAIHAGLECGLFSIKLPGVDMISFGPEIYDPHTPDERICISSVERTWEFLKEALKVI